MLLPPAWRHLPYGALVQLTFIGHFYNMLLPGQVGGEAVKSVRLAQLGVSPAGAVFSVVADRITGLLALLVLGAVGITLAPPSGSSMDDLATWLICGAAVLFLVVLVLLTDRGN